ncbi:MAG TPA: relaxase/mobilization nuclease domain-containing protein [Candidatus Tumulicola sp.]|jgi:hypothetical protein
MITKSVPARAHTRTFAIGVDYITEHRHQRAVAAAGRTFEGGVAYASAEGKAEWVHLRGVLSVETAPIEMEAVAALSRRCRDPVYHMIVAYAKHERPTREQVVSDAERHLKAIGMSDHQYVLAAHKDTDDFHAHVIANRIGPDGRANDLWHERIIRERVCAEIAAERGWGIDAMLQEEVGTYVHESFYAVYRDGGDAVVTETSPTGGGGIEPMRAALEGENEPARLTAQGGQGIVLRFGGFYSAEAPSTRITVDLVRKRMLPRIGRGTFYLPAIYVEDAASAVVAALSSPAGVYNVCDDDPVTFATYLDELAKALAAKPPLHLPEFLGPVLVGYPWRVMSHSVRMSNARLKQITAWKPQVESVREGWPLIVSLLASKPAPNP